MLDNSIQMQFEAKAAAVGAEVHRCATRQAALDLVVDFLRDEGVADAPGCHALWADSGFLSGLDQDRLKRTPGVKLAVNRQLASQAKFGISKADWALADTGSLVQDQTGVEQRLVSSLPEIHIALLPSARVLGGKAKLFARIDPRTSRYIAFITGPSRTADIERVLTIGVHGPQGLIVVIYDEAGGEQQ